MYGWNLSTWIQSWSRLINTSIPGILKPQLYPIVQQERKWLFQRLCGVLLYSMGGLARPRVNLWHHLGSQPPPALRVARDTACHSARSIPPPVDIMCVRIYTVCEYLLCANIYWLQISTGRGPSVLISLKSCHPLSESLILHFKHKRSRDTRDHPTTRGLYFFSVRKLIFQDYSTLWNKRFSPRDACVSLKACEYILSQGTQTIPKWMSKRRYGTCLDQDPPPRMFVCLSALDSNIDGQPRLSGFILARGSRNSF